MPGISRPERLRRILNKTRKAADVAGIKVSDKTGKVAIKNRYGGRYHPEDLEFALPEITRFFNEFKPLGLGNGFHADLYLGRHESRFELRLSQKLAGKNFTVGRMRIAFTRRGSETEVLINAMQGVKGNKNRMEAARESLGQKWSEQLVQIVIDHAYKLGYSKVKLVNAENQEYFRLNKTNLELQKFPLEQGKKQLKRAKGTSREKKYSAKLKRLEERFSKTQQRLDRFRGNYDGWASKLGFIKGDDGFWVLRFPRAK